MKRLPIILFAQTTSPYFREVEQIVSRMHDILGINPDALEFDGLLKKSGNSREDVWVISAENPIIIKEPFLSCHSFNIHRAPPWYPGWGGLVRAMADRRAEHGVVAHRMLERVDAGEILDQEMFAVEPDETFTSLDEKTCRAGLRLLDRMCARIGVEKPPLEARSQLEWGAEKLSLKQVISLIERTDAPWTPDAHREYSSYL